LASLNEFLTNYNIDENIVFDETIHRFSFDGKRDKAGWYIAFNDGDIQIVVAGDFRSGDKWTYCSGKDNKLSAEYKARIEAARAKAKADKEKRHIKAQETASELLKKAKPFDPLVNQYLKKKNITETYGISLIDNYLAIPIQNNLGQVTSLQKIYPDGSKRFLTGGKITACYFIIGEITDVVYICEGFATGASIHKATGKCVFCAFSANNIEPVYKALQSNYEGIDVVIASDNDAFKKENAGLKVAATMVKKYDLDFRAPTFKDPSTKPTDFNDLEILEGIEAVKQCILEPYKEVLPAVKSKAAAAWELAKLSLNPKTKLPVKNEVNVFKLLKIIPGFSDSIYYDKFLNRMVCHGSPMVDEFYTEVLMELQENYGFASVARGKVISAVDNYAMKNSKNSAKDYLESTVWDNNKRIDTFFVDYCNSEVSDDDESDKMSREYVSAVSKNFWVGMVARIMSPGCKLDTMIILEGAQGIKKSTMLEVIGGKWYGIASSEIGHKDFYEGLAGNLILEMAELDHMKRADMDTIKRVLSTRNDKYRPAYGRLPRDYPRQTVIVGTSNDS